VLSDYETMRQSGPGVTELQRELNAASLAVGLLAPPGAGSQDLLDIGSVGQRLSVVSLPPRRTKDGQLLVYPTQFHPGTTSAARAERISLGAREERSGIVMQVQPIPSATVSGTLTGPAGPGAHLAVRLVAIDAGRLLADLDIAATVSDANGNFAFAAVPTGDYLLKILKLPRAPGSAAPTAVIETGAEPITVSTTTPGSGTAAIPDGPTIWASEPVSVGRAGITDLQITLRHGARITGRVEFSGATPAPTGDALQRINVAVHTADDRNLTGNMLASGTSPVGRVDAQGQIRLPGLPAGGYTFNVGSPPAGWVIKSITVEGRDAWETPIDLGSHDLSTLVITFTDRPSRIVGHVADTTGQPAAAARLYLFPADRARWNLAAALGQTIRTFTADATGRFTTPSVRPGEYFIVAIRGSEPFSPSWSEPARLNLLSALADRVQLAEGQQLTHNLTMRAGR
jgi:hypothetical protein